MNRLKVLVFGLVLMIGQVALADVLINGAGSTFAAPLYNRWASEFKKVNTEAKINYQGMGSGAGVQQFLKKTVDFGASDDPLKNEENKNRFLFLRKYFRLNRFLVILKNQLLNPVYH